MTLIDTAFTRMIAYMDRGYKKSCSEFHETNLVLFFAISFRDIVLELNKDSLGDLKKQPPYFFFEFPSQQKRFPARADSIIVYEDTIYIIEAKAEIVEGTRGKQCKLKGLMAQGRKWEENFKYIFNAMNFTEKNVFLVLLGQARSSDMFSQQSIRRFGRLDNKKWRREGNISQWFLLLQRKLS